MGAEGGGATINGQPKEILVKVLFMRANEDRSCVTGIEIYKPYLYRSSCAFRHVYGSESWNYGDVALTGRFNYILIERSLRQLRFQRCTHRDILESVETSLSWNHCRALYSSLPVESVLARISSIRQVISPIKYLKRLSESLCVVSRTQSCTSPVRANRMLILFLLFTMLQY